MNPLRWLFGDVRKELAGPQGTREAHKMTGSPWRHHPHVRTGDALTLGERAADRMRNSFGSWAFIFATCVFLAVWMLFNGHHGFDPFPWILLNLILSCFAAMQGAIILLAAKRADSVAAEQATAHYGDTATLSKLLAENTALTKMIAEQTATLDEIHRHVQVLSPQAGRLRPPGGQKEKH